MKPFTLVTATGFFLTVVLALMADSAPADLYTPAPANSPSATTGYCNSVCSALVNSNGQVLGLNGTVGWSVADDLWCANHGAQTNPLVGSSPVPNAAPPPTGSCPVTLVPGDTSCDQAVAMAAHCQWHNGQLEQQCEAYETADKGMSSEKVVLDLDIAATGICAGACAANVATVGAAQAACTDSGLLASTTELIETLSMKSSEMSKAIGAATGALGIGKTLYPLMTGTKNPGELFLGKSGPTAANPAGAGASNATSSSTATSNGTSAANQGTSGTASGTSQTAGETPPKQSRTKNAACTSALLFAAMTGVRYSDISSQKSTKQNACSEVASLASAAPTIGSNGVLIPSNVGGGSTGVTSGANTGASEGASSSLTCIGSGGSVTSCTGTSASAPDVAALDTSGLGQQVAPEAAQLDNSPLVSDGGSAGDAAGQAASAAGAPSDISGAVSTVASAAQAGSHALFEKTGSMDGGGGGGEDSPQQANPMAMLASLFGQKNAQRQPSGGMTVYSSAQNADIWHTNSQDNLFQIVSDRIQKDSSRVQ